MNYSSDETIRTARPAPFLARNPWVGYLIFLIFGAAFVWLSWQVLIQGPVTQWDMPTIKAIHDWATHQSAPVALIMRFFSAYGRDGVSLITVILTIGWVRRKYRRGLWMLLFGVMGAELWFQALGGIINRQRPEFKDPFETLIGAGYPSGHAATNVLLGWMILYLLLPHIKSGFRRGLLIIVVVAVVLEVCFSRLFLGLHYPTDIIGGLLMGIAWGGLIFTITDRHFFAKKREVVHLQPAAMPVTGEKRPEK